MAAAVGAAAVVEEAASGLHFFGMGAPDWGDWEQSRTARKPPRGCQGTQCNDMVAARLVPVASVSVFRLTTRVPSYHVHV